MNGAVDRIGDRITEYLTGLKRSLGEERETAVSTDVINPMIAFEYNFKGLYHNHIFKHTYISGLKWFSEHFESLDNFLGKFMFEPFSWFYFGSPFLYSHETIRPLRTVTALSCDERKLSAFVRHRTRIYAGEEAEVDPMIEAVLYRQYVEVNNRNLLTAVPASLTDEIRSRWPEGNRFRCIDRAADRIVRITRNLPWHGPSEEESFVTVSQCEYAGMFMMLGDAHVFDLGKELLVNRVKDPAVKRSVLQTYGANPWFVARDGHKCLYHRDRYLLRAWFAQAGKLKIFRYQIEGGVPPEKALSGVEIYL